MIDLKAARAEPDAWRAALARKGAGEAFDALLAADERWRSLVPRVDDLRSRTKLKGKPTPEQLEELQQVKEELRAAEEELAAAETARDEALALVPNPPHDSAPDGDTEDDAVEIRRFGEPPALAEAKEASEIGRFELERAARLSGSRFGYIVGDTALLALSLYRFALDHVAAAGFTPVLPPVLVREEAMIGTGFFPTEKSNIYELEQDGLFLTGTSEVALAAMHMTEILEAGELPLALRRFLDLLPPRGRRGGQGHPRDVPRAPVQQGRDVRLHDARRRLGGARPDGGARGGPADAARPSLPRRQRRGRRPRRSRRQEDRHRGVVPEPRSATAR